jgi:glycosyltransferase involved in cell wall biosynthesis
MAVNVFDRAPSRALASKTQLVQFLRPLRYLMFCASDRQNVLYLALSGGLGQIIDLLYVLVGKIFGRRIFIHHHSFAYINASPWVSRCFFRFVRNASHIVLSNGMGAALKQRYRLNDNSVQVVSNAAFYISGGDAAQHAAVDQQAPIRIGFLSNITREKGFIEFFEILSRLRQDGIAFNAQIAGPCADSSRRQLDELLAAAADVRYLGALYGDHKDQFYRELDVFVFPTKYVNEAEPLVLYEAMHAGAYVIACDRGAIREMLANDAGDAFSPATIVADACKRITELSRDRASLLLAKTASLNQMLRIRSSGAVELERLLDAMAGADSQPK